MQRTDVDGYTVKQLDGDLARWFVDAEPVAIDPGVQSVDAFAARLPAPAAASLRAFDAKVRGGSMPSLWLLDIMEDWTYGFDFVKNGASVLDENGVDVAADVWALGCDGSGNYYVLRTDGRVGLWCPSDGDVIDPSSYFASLDVFLWAKTRRAAVRAKNLAREDIEADLASLDDDGARSLFV